MSKTETKESKDVIEKDVEKELIATEPVATESAVYRRLVYIDLQTGLTATELRKWYDILTKIDALYTALSEKETKTERKNEERRQKLFIKQKFSGLSFEEKERLIALVLEEAESEEKDLVLEEAGSKNETEELSSIIEV